MNPKKKTLKPQTVPTSNLVGVDWGFIDLDLAYADDRDGVGESATTPTKRGTKEKKLDDFDEFKASLI